MKLNDSVSITRSYNPYTKSQSDEIRGSVISFIPGYEEGSEAVVIRLDDTISLEGITSDVIVLELRYEEASWHGEIPPEGYIVGMDLYSTVPERSMASVFLPEDWVSLDSHGIVKIT